MKQSSLVIAMVVATTASAVDLNEIVAGLAESTTNGPIITANDQVIDYDLGSGQVTEEAAADAITQAIQDSAAESYGPQYGSPDFGYQCAPGPDLAGYAGSPELQYGGAYCGPQMSGQNYGSLFGPSAYGPGPSMQSQGGYSSSYGNPSWTGMQAPPVAGFGPQTFGNTGYGQLCGQYGQMQGYPQYSGMGGYRGGMSSYGQQYGGMSQCQQPGYGYQNQGGYYGGMSSQRGYGQMSPRYGNSYGQGQMGSNYGQTRPSYGNMSGGRGQMGPRPAGFGQGTFSPMQGCQPSQGGSRYGNYQQSQGNGIQGSRPMLRSSAPDLFAEETDQAETSTSGTQLIQNDYQTQSQYDAQQANQQYYQGY